MFRNARRNRLRKESDSQVWEGHDFTGCGKCLVETGLAPSPDHPRTLVGLEREGHGFSRATSSSINIGLYSLRKISGIRHEREGHEFYSSRKGRRINDGFQPLREFLLARTLFQQTV